MITPGRASIGWADDKFESNFFTGHGVGDDEHSWGFDPGAAERRHQGKPVKWCAIFTVFVISRR